MRVESYHDTRLNHWAQQAEFRQWCILNGVRAKWICGSHFRGTNGEWLQPQTWEIKDKDHAVLALLSWS